MQLPVELVSFDKWSAFKGPFPTRDKGHRIVIIYKSGDEVSYFYVTSYESKEEKQKIDLANRKDISSIAELKKEDWDALTKDSCIQCNLAHRHEIKLADLQTGYASGGIEYIGVVPDAIKSRIIDATCRTPTFTEEQKRLYTAD